jgi:hypothetical protein
MIAGLTGDAVSPTFSTELVWFSKMMLMMMLTLVSGPHTSVETVHISAYADSGATISGLPAILDQLLQSRKPPKASSIKLRVNGLYHAPHFHDSGDVNNILAASDSLSSLHQKGRIPPFSSTSFETELGTPSTVLLKTAISEILLAPLRLDKICDSLVTHLTRASVQSCGILPVAALVAQALVVEFNRAGIAQAHVDKSIMNHTASSDSAIGNMAHSKLTVIAYSGRCPGAQSNEPF